MADQFIEMTTEIVSSFVVANKVPVDTLPGLIQTVFRALTSLSAPAEPESPTIQKATPAQLRRSIKPEGLVSFEDGKTYRTLKRHLTARGITVAEYKEKWGLPADYPTTAPNYSAARSEVAKSRGLGRAGRKDNPAPVSKRQGKRPKAKA